MLRRDISETSLGHLSSIRSCQPFLEPRENNPVKQKRNSLGEKRKKEIETECGPFIGKIIKVFFPLLNSSPRNTLHRSRHIVWQSFYRSLSVRFDTQVLYPYRVDRIMCWITELVDCPTEKMLICNNYRTQIYLLVFFNK